MKLRSVLPLAVALVLASACSIESPASSDSSPSKGSSVTIAIDGYKGPEAELPREFPAPPSGQKSFTIGFLNPVASNENLKAIQDAAEAETKKLGGKFIAKDDRVSVATQLQDFNELLVQGADAILVYPLDPRALGPSLAAAKVKRVPVIGYDVTTTAGESLPDGYATQILQARDWQAWLMAKAMADAQPKGKIGLIGISIPVPGIKYLVQRIKYWAGDMGLDVIGEQDNTEGDTAPGGQAAGTALLGAHPDLDGIIAFNDPSAVGAASAAKLAGRKITIVGDNGDSNGISGIESGSLSATFQNDAVGQGVQGVIAAFDVLHGVSVPPTVARPPLVAITSANVGDVSGWTQQLSKLN